MRCDICGSSLGAVLQQDGLVIAYESILLSRAEKVAQAYETELLAIVYAEGKNNMIANTLISQTTTFSNYDYRHHELDDMREQYANDPDFESVIEKMQEGEVIPGFTLKDGFLMRRNKLCLTRALRKNLVDVQALTKLRLTRNTLSREEKEAFQALVEEDGFYSVRVPANVSSPGQDTILSSVKARCLAAANLQERFEFYMV
ncbi:hypothetical protein L7F22_041791 [Adiantum nelumboides]|nr:hypothetical protein [Adiantum nelumboides]